MTKNIKEIGKELMGKSLNSFHKKTGLPQLEKNNEMQDGILDGILSQVDDAYIEKTEQSNVIHLDGSGDGVVVLDSIEGNTMVNLIGDIPSTANTVLYGDYNGFHLSVKTLNTWNTVYFRNVVKKPNTTYTYVVYVDDVVGNVDLRGHISETSGAFKHMFLQKGLNLLTFTTNNISGQFYDDYVGFRPNECLEGCYIKIRYAMLLEGDWTDKELPSYFEGLQSSFEEKVNENGKYEIEILMNNKNLIDNSKSYQSSYASWIANIGSLNNVIKTDTYNATFHNRGVGFLVKDLKPNTQYTLSIPSLLTNNRLCYALYNDVSSINSWTSHIQGQGNITDNKITFTTPNRKTVAVVGVYGEYGVLNNGGAMDGTIVIGNYRELQLEVGSKNTEFDLQKQNKIKLLINEPLRGIGDVKDRFVFKDGNKLMIERNCKEIVLNGSKYENWQYQGDTDVNTGKVVFNNVYRAVIPLSDIDYFSWTYLLSIDTSNYITSDKFISLNTTTENNLKDIEKILLGDYGRIMIDINKHKLSSNDKDSFKLYLQDNPVTVVYKLAEPIYEEVTNEYGEPIILEGYENGTLYIDSTIAPTTSVRYTPKMESFKTIKEVKDNNIMLTSDINDTIIPYMMEVDLMIMEKEMSLFNSLNKNIRKIGAEDMTSMQKRTGEMLERLIKGKSLNEQECKTRVTVYLNASKITDEQAEELMLLISEIYA